MTCADSEPSMDRLCSDDHLVIIAEGLVEWEMAAYILGLSEAEVEEIDKSYTSTDIPLKRIKMLMKWKNKYKEDATYQRLVTAFSFLERYVTVEHVCKLLTTPSTEVTRTSSFADHLKRWYASTDPDPTSWPPIDRGKFRKLAIVKIEHSVVNAGTIVKKKVPVDLDNIFVDEQELKKRKTILIEGAPGSGKSTLLWYMCQKWASGEMFQEFGLVIYIELREYSTTQSPRSVAEILPCNSKTKERALDEIKADDGKGVLFLLDGWDELPQKSQNDSIFKDIITSSPKHSLLHSTVVVTSRYGSSDELHSLATSRLETLGFADQEVKECIMDIASNEEAAHALMEALESRPSLLSSCHLPLNAIIVTHMFKVKMNNLPATLLEAFKLLIVNCIQRHAKNRQPHMECEGIPSLEFLPKYYQSSFHSLCELAFFGLLQDRRLFSNKDLNSIPDTLSILYGTKMQEKTQSKTMYSFFHPTIQELLAAIHMSRMPPDDQIDYFQNLYAQQRFHTLIQFYAGVTSLHLTETVSILSDSVNLSSLHDQSAELKLFKSHSFKKKCFSHLKVQELCKEEYNYIQSKYEQYIAGTQSAEPTNETAAPTTSHGKEIRLLANCFYESNNPVLYDHFKVSEIRMINLPMSPSDCLSLGFLIARSHIQHVLLAECDLSYKCMKSLKQGLGESSCICDLRIFDSSFNEQSIKCLTELIITNRNISKLCLRLCNLEHNGLTYILHALKGCPIQTLDLMASNVQVNDINGPVLQEFIIRMTSLEALDLACNFQIGDIGAYYIGEALKYKSSLRTLNLSQCGITLDGIMLLCESLQKNRILTDLDLSGNDISDDGINYLSQSLAMNWTLITLKIKNSQFTELGIQSLASMLFQNTTIATILWDGNVKMTNQELKQMLEQCGLLTPSVAAILFCCAL